MKNIALAKKFSAIIKAWLTTEEIELVVQKNETPEYTDCCASHDYCDPNVAMAEAFNELTGKEIDLQNGADLSLWNEAWDIAKVNKFYTEN